VSKIQLIRAKLERAEKHISDVDAAIRVFFESRPYVIVAKQDQKTGDYVSYVESVRDVPVNVPLIAGDAIHNIRSALDHLAWQLVLSAGNTPGQSTSFPIFDTAAKYETRSHRRAQAILRWQSIALATPSVGYYRQAPDGCHSRIGPQGKHYYAERQK
jgi:hypothetical protein